MYFAAKPPVLFTSSLNWNKVTVSIFSVSCFYVTRRKSYQAINTSALVTDSVGLK